MREGRKRDNSSADSLSSEMSPDSNLILTGFMGTGKTTVGRLVAEKLGREFVDTDLVIEERHGPIQEIFDRQGESASVTSNGPWPRNLAGGRVS